ncbi:hypothetical protein GC194_03345 [bacterium]|nr:hypothetical protein [bacterium]
MRHFILVISLFLLAFAAKAADSSYTVVWKFGKIYYYNTKAQNWQVLASTDTVSNQSKVRMGHTCYLLLHSPQGYLEFTHSGTYNIGDYNGRIKQLMPLIADYEKLAADSLMAVSNRKASFYKKSILDAQTTPDLVSMSPTATVVTEREIELKWRPKSKGLTFVKIYHSESSVYFYRELLEDRITIDLAELHMPSDRCLYWTVTDKASGYTSTPHCIYYLNSLESSVIDIDVYHFNENLNLEKSAFHNLMMALYYEKNNIMYKAEACYLTALALASHAERYKELYYNFLERRNTVSID